MAKNTYDGWKLQPSASKMQKAAPKGNRSMPERDVNNWQEPFTGGYDRYSSIGPGLGGVNYGNCGTQGPKAIKPESSGEAGLRGEKLGMGTNRKG